MEDPIISKRISIENDPFVNLEADTLWRKRGNWACNWISCPTAGEPPFVTAYHLRFTLEEDVEIRIHVTADERYDLYLDGIHIGKGSERGDADNWFYESYLLTLSAGEHMLAARVWGLGDLRPLAQMSVHHGFLLCAEGSWGAVLSTGHAEWLCKKLDGYSFEIPPSCFWRGARMELDAKDYSWGFEHGAGDDWQLAVAGKSGIGQVIDYAWFNIHRLQASTLPPMLYIERHVGYVRYVTKIDSNSPENSPIHSSDNIESEQEQWQNLLSSQTDVVIPPHSYRRILIDLDEYYCMYPELLVSGGQDSVIRLHSAESLYLNPDITLDKKGHRDEIEGKYFVGYGDIFRPDGEGQRCFDTLWWQAGRYWELIIETKAQALSVHHLSLRETRYPLEMESSLTTDDTRFELLSPMFIRSIQACSHETYYDAPYYEELMYAGDTRLEMLTSYVMAEDDRLPRKAIRLFDSSRLSSGMIQARYPSWETQVIAPFSLWWVAMLHDYAYWRDATYVQQFLPGMRATLEGFQRFLDDDGIISSPEGWNFVDWVKDWETGIPPEGIAGHNATINWHFIYALRLAADLEKQIGEPELARLWQRRAETLAERVMAIFWDETRGLIAEDSTRKIFSEHTQALALLSGLLDETTEASITQGLLNDPDLIRTTYYFSHYLFEAYGRQQEVEALQNRLKQWDSLDELGLKTTVESPDPTRSDCHAWAAHPLFHYFATFVGIRPTSPNFQTVAIRPQLGNMTEVDCTLVHPLGHIRVHLKITDEQVYADISLPDNVSGVFHIDDNTYPLNPLRTVIEI